MLLYKRTWRGSMVTSFLSPVLFLAAMGLGLGSLVDDRGDGALGTASYLAFVAPGLLAAAAMQTAAGECTYPVMAAIKWLKTYEAMLATPLREVDLVAGRLAFVAFRLTTGAGVFLLVMTAFGAVDSPLGILAFPAAVLCGMAFAAPITAFAASQEDDTGFSALFRFGIIPLFLFSGTFFPVSQLPAALQPVAWLTPLWHGVELCRGLTQGTISPAAAFGHAAVLAGFAVAGTLAAVRVYRWRLVG
jgi:lipooligosaccharide transport system permease protein